MHHDIVLAFRDLSSLRTHFWPFTEVVRRIRREVTRKNWNEAEPRIAQTPELEKSKQLRNSVVTAGSNSRRPRRRTPYKRDLEEFFERLVPEDADYFTHPVLFLGVQASPRCPGFRDSAARGSFSTCRRPMVKAYELGGMNPSAGLIHIVADLDASLPSPYPAPASKVTVTLYDWLEADPLRSGSVSI